MYTGCLLLTAGRLLTPHDDAGLLETAYQFGNFPDILGNVCYRIAITYEPRPPRSQPLNGPENVVSRSQTLAGDREIRENEVIQLCVFCCNMLVHTTDMFT